MNPDIEKKHQQYGFRVAVILNNPLSYSNLFYRAAKDIGFDLKFEEIPGKIQDRHPKNSIFVLAADERDIDRSQVLRSEFTKQKSDLLTFLQNINTEKIERGQGPDQLKSLLALSLRALLDQLKSNPIYAPEFED